MWTFELKPCVSAVKLNAERAADDFHLNAHATIVYIYTIIGRSLVNICKGLEPGKCRSMNARSRPFLPNDGPWTIIWDSLYSARHTEYLSVLAAKTK